MEVPERDAGWPQQDSASKLYGCGDCATAHRPLRANQSKSRQVHDVNCIAASLGRQRCFMRNEKSRFRIASCEPNTLADEVIEVQLLATMCLIGVAFKDDQGLDHLIQAVHTRAIRIAMMKRTLDHSSQTSSIDTVSSSGCRQ